MTDPCKPAISSPPINAGLAIAGRALADRGFRPVSRAIRPIRAQLPIGVAIAPRPASARPAPCNAHSPHAQANPPTSTERVVQPATRAAAAQPATTE